MKLFVRRRDAEALLNGQPLTDDAGLGDVEAFLADMRVEFGAQPAPAPRPTLAATLDGRRPLRPATEPVPKLTFPKPRPGVHLLRPVAAVFATGVVLFGGLATAGALPGPAQRATASLGTHLGLHLPGEPASSNPSKHDVPSGTMRTDTPGSASTTPRHGTTATTVPVAPTPGATVVPTPGATVLPTPPTTVAGIAPNLPTTPTLPAPAIPNLTDPTNPLQQLIDRLTGSGGPSNGLSP